MLHYSPAGKRKEVYAEVHRILRKTGLLSVYPKHLEGDYPADHFKSMNIQKLTREIEKAGFTLEDRLDGTMSHANSLVQGRVLNFRKK
jgi:predicted methyltransferase